MSGSLDVAGDEAEEGAGGGEAADEAADGEATGGAANDALELELLALGAAADEEELRSRLEGALSGDELTPEAETSTTTLDDTRSADPAGARGASEACQIQLEETDPSLAGLVVRATATYAGTPAVVYLYLTSDGHQQVVVVTADDCTLLASFPF